jgi:hypothetical protein
MLLNVLQPTNELPRPGGRVICRVLRTSGAIGSSTVDLYAYFQELFFFCRQYVF